MENSKVEAAKKLDNSKIDIALIKDDFSKNLSENAYEHDILLENNLVEPNIVLSLKYATYRLENIFNQIINRYIFLGTHNSQLYEIFNCILSQQLLTSLNNIIVILRPSESYLPGLYSATLDQSFGINFKENKLITQGFKEITETLTEYDNILNINLAVDVNDLTNHVFIVTYKFPENFNIAEKTELLFFPVINSERRAKFCDIITRFISQDEKFIAESEGKNKSAIINNIKSKTDLIISDDMYFENYISNRVTKRNIVINVISIDNLLSDAYLDLFEITKSANNTIQNYLIINNYENMCPSFISNLNESIRLKPDFANESNVKEYESLSAMVRVLGDNKIANELKVEICKRYLTKVVHLMIHFKNVVTLFLSSSYTFMNRINSSEDVLTKQAYFESLYSHNMENTIYESFNDFKQSKLNFMLKKSNFYEKEFLHFEKLIVDNVKYHTVSETNHYYSSYLRYSTIINDLLNISTTMFNNIQLNNEDDLQNLLSEYRKIVHVEYIDYLTDLKIFEDDSLKDFTEICHKLFNEIEAWSNSIYIHTGSKIDELTDKFKQLYTEMKNKSDIYFNEVVEKDIFLIIAIKNKLSSAGFLNDFITNYLTNMQSSLSYEMAKIDYNHDDRIKSMILNIGISTGAGVVAGLVGFGVTRAFTIFSTNVITASAAGPIGTIAGATVSTLSLVGTSIYHFTKNKQIFKEKFEEYAGVYKEFKGLLVDKINELNCMNQKEVDSRLKNLLSYVEYSIRKSHKHL
jgi:hypothetical protein